MNNDKSGKFEDEGKNVNRGNSTSKGIIFDEDLLEAVDSAAKAEGKSRSEFTREALREKLNKL